MCKCWECDYPTAIRDTEDVFAEFKCGFGDSPCYDQPINDSTGCEYGEIDGVKQN